MALMRESGEIGTSTRPAEQPIVGGRYLLQRRLGRGGMAEVFEALDSQTGELLALKRLHLDLTELPGEGEIVRLIDFGIARFVEAATSTYTRDGNLVGTPEYMAPEVLTDGPREPHPRMDVYALGVLLYRMLTGRSPWHGMSG